MAFDINRICRVCLEESTSLALTSLFTGDYYGVAPFSMLMNCAKVQIESNDGMPPHICDNCIYRLGVAYHFKQQCENSDIRLRQYLGLNFKLNPSTEDVAVNTDYKPVTETNDDEMKKLPMKKRIRKRSSYKEKPNDIKLKRGPKPKPKDPQTCFECGKTFKCAAQLEMHIRTHTGERPFACNFCPRSFAQKHNLSIHLRIHTGEKPFQCEICSKQFRALGNFQSHKKIHIGIKDQVCPVCNKGFFCASDLSKHMVVHSGIKNHHCDICGKGFHRNRDMVSHKNRKHKDEISRTTTELPTVTSMEHSMLQQPGQSSVPRRPIMPSLLAAPAPRRPIQGYREDAIPSNPPILITHVQTIHPKINRSDHLYQHG